MRGRRALTSRRRTAALVVGVGSAMAATAVVLVALSPSGRTSSLPVGPGSTRYDVVGLGDSVPAGDACGCTSFVSLVAQELGRRTGRGSSVANLAVGGLTTRGLQAQLQQQPVRDAVAAADLVIVTVGANDFDPGVLTTEACGPVTELPCYRQTLAAQRQVLSGVLSQVNGLTARRGATVLVTGYWNVFLDGRVGRARGDVYRQRSDALTLSENALIQSLSQAGGDTYVDLYTPFKGNGTADDTALLAPDGDHPDAAGHALIARTVLDAAGRPDSGR